jgi:ribosomal protein S12 methylthiotransferase accessory factor
MEMEIRFPGRKRVEALFDEYTVTTDQPFADGGSGSAPSPFDLFLASIGTCTGYYVLSFCKKNDIPTEKMSLTVNIQRNPATHLVENIRIDIHVPSEFPEKYKKAVVKAAGLCTVKRNLQNPPTIEIQLDCC